MSYYYLLFFVLLSTLEVAHSFKKFGDPGSRTSEKSDLNLGVKMKGKKFAKKKQSKLKKLNVAQSNLWRIYVNKVVSSTKSVLARYVKMMEEVVQPY